MKCFMKETAFVLARNIYLQISPCSVDLYNKYVSETKCSLNWFFPFSLEKDDVLCLWENSVDMSARQGYKQAWLCGSLYNPVVSSSIPLHSTFFYNPEQTNISWVNLIELDWPEFIVGVGFIHVLVWIFTFYSSCPKISIAVGGWHFVDVSLPTNPISLYFLKTGGMKIPESRVR